MSAARTFIALCGLFAAALVTSPPAGVAEDPVLCIGEVPTITGTEGADIITGTPERDVIIGFGGDDLIYGFGGPDLICGFDGDDTLIGGDGDDWIFGGPGADNIKGGNGRDEIHGEDGPDEIRGGGRSDVIYGGAGADVIFGRAGDDTIYGGIGNDRIRGQAGADLIDGSLGKDRCVAEIEYNCEIARVGERIDVFQGPEVLEFPAGEPFHVWHGWACNPLEVDCAIAGAGTVDFQLFFNGIAMEPKGIELATIVDEWRFRLWVFNFPEGLSGIFTVRGVWTQDGETAFSRDITVTFS